MTESTDIAWRKSLVTRDARQGLNRHRGVVVWLTGLSGCGKSTVAHAVAEKLHALGCRTFALDGDNVRDGLYGDLGLSEQDRDQNIRRMGGQARAGEVYDCTGISSRYEQPDKPELVVDTGRVSLDQCGGQVIEYLQGRGVLSPS